MKKIKVLEMIDQPFLGGGQVNLLSLAKGLDKNQFEVSVCSRDGGPLVEEAKKNNIPHFPVDLSKKYRKEIIQEIVSILENNSIDILHTHGGVAGIHGRWAAHKSQNPVLVVHTLHGIHYLHYRNSLLKHLFILLERYFSNFTNAVIFVSDEDRKKGSQYKLAPEGKMHLIKNGINFSTYKTAEDLRNQAKKKQRELGLEGYSAIVGSVARLHRQKGIIYLLRAAKEICIEFPHTKILVIGSGPLEKRLKRVVRRQGLGQCVWFMGERTDAAEILSLLDVFILPSLWEGLPYVLMEASAMKKPVVATDVDGIKEMLDDGRTGILVPPKNPKKLAQAVIHLLQDKDYAMRLGEQLREDIRPRYALTRMIEETQSLYLKLYSHLPSN